MVPLLLSIGRRGWPWFNLASTTQGLSDSSTEIPASFFFFLGAISNGKPAVRLRDPHLWAHPLIGARHCVSVRARSIDPRSSARGSFSALAFLLGLGGANRRNTDLFV